jgi:hypothetical protein
MVREVKIDLTIVSGARPKLLHNTLQSLSRYVLPSFDIVQVFANIDKFGGGQSEAIECRSIIESFFPNAIIFMPEVNGFASAVKKLWSLPTAEHFLHIEDDWEFLAKIESNVVKQHFGSGVTQVTIDNSDKHRPLFWKGHWKSLFTYWRFAIPDFRRPIFTTSPSFIESSFGREIAKRMNPDYDPEKQLYSGINQDLSTYTKPYKSKFLYPRRGYYVVDTGRVWREEKGIQKTFIQGKSIWKFEL